MRRTLLFLPSCLVVAMLAGCGQKGPLVMPPPKPVPVKATTTTVAPAAAASSAEPATSQH